MQKFQIGQQVKYINGNGVLIGVKTITGKVEGEESYYIAPTDAPWFAIPADRLTAIDDPLPERKFRVTYWNLSDGLSYAEVPAEHADQAVQIVKNDDRYLFAQFKNVDEIR